MHLLNIKYAGILLLGLISGLLSTVSIAQELMPDTPEENILKNKGTEEDPLWRLPLGPVHISEMIQMGEDTMFLGLKSNEKLLPSRECLLINLATGEPIWRHPFRKRTTYDLFSATATTLHLLGETEGTQVLTALDMGTGDPVWEYREKGNQSQFHALPVHEMILLDNRSKRSASIAAMSMHSGEVVWMQDFDYSENRIKPGLYVQEGVVLHFFNGISRISIEDGQMIWSRPDMVPGKNDPPPQTDQDTLFISCNDVVSAMDLNTGRSLWKSSVDLFTTNLFPLEKILMVRGEQGYKDSNGKYEFHLGDGWMVDEKINASVTRYRDDMTGAFILIACMEDTEDPDVVFKIMEDALNGLSKGSPRKISVSGDQLNPVQAHWQGYEGKILREKNEVPFNSVIGTLWDPEKKRAAGFMGYCEADLYPSAEEDILKSFSTFEFGEPLSVADSWAQRAQAAGKDKYTMVALDRSTGDRQWSFTSEKPTLSNFLESEDAIYVATSGELFALERSSGKLIFRTELSQSEANFPVHIMQDGEKIYFIGELIIAALDATTGERIYSHGITPIDFNVSVAGLDNAIPIYTEMVRAASSAESPAVMNISSIRSAESRRYQNLANQYARKSDHYYSTGDQFGYELSEIRRQSASNMAKFEANMAFAWSMVELGQALSQALMKKALLDRYQDLLSRQILFRKSIVSGYTMAEVGEFVYRPHRKLSAFGEDDFTPLTSVHLPTGQRRTTVLSPTYLNYGLWNMVDLDRGVVYHHGIGLDPEHYEMSDRINLGTEGRVQTVNTYLIAAPVRIPR